MHTTPWASQLKKMLQVSIFGTFSIVYIMLCFIKFFNNTFRHDYTFNSVELDLKVAVKRLNLVTGNIKTLFIICTKSRLRTCQILH